MNWKDFFNSQKTSTKNFKSPSFLTKQKNISKIFEYYGGPIIFEKQSNSYLMKYGEYNNKYRDINIGSYVSLSVQKIKYKNTKITININNDSYEFKFRDIILIYFTEESIYIFKNYNIISVYSLVENFNITFNQYAEYELDYKKEYLEIVNTNVFSFTESLLKKVSEDLSEKFDIYENDILFIKYILGHKPEEIEKYVSLEKIEELNAYYDFKGTYKDLDFIKKLNLFNKLEFNDENSSYLNFLNYVFNIDIEKMEKEYEIFLRNENLWNKYKDTFKCIYTGKGNFSLEYLENISLGDCSYNKENVRGIYFVDDIYDNKIIFRQDIKLLGDIVDRKIEIIKEVKDYIEVLKEIKGQDFEQNDLAIDNNANIKISNTEAFKIPGEEINFKGVSLEGNIKECYLDYRIKINIDNLEEIYKFNEHINSYKQILLERMPFYLKVYFEELVLNSNTIYELSNIDENNEIDIELSNIDIFEPFEGKNKFEFDIDLNVVETFDDNTIDEKLEIYSQGSKSPYGFKIMGSGIVKEKDNLITKGFVQNNEKILINGSNKEDVIKLNNIKIAKRCITKDNDKLVDVLVTFDKAISQKHLNGNIAKCRFAMYNDKYKNRVIYHKMFNHFEYIENTSLKDENINELYVLNNPWLPAGNYSHYGKWTRNTGKFKIYGPSIIHNNEPKSLNIKELYLVGKGDKEYILRDYFNKDYQLSKIFKIIGDYVVLNLKRFKLDIREVKNNNFLIREAWFEKYEHINNIDNLIKIGGKFVYKDNRPYILDLSKIKNYIVLERFFPDDEKI